MAVLLCLWTELSVSVLETQESSVPNVCSLSLFFFNTTHAVSSPVSIPDGMFFLEFVA